MRPPRHVLALERVCGPVSCAIHWALWGQWMSLCARAWWLSDQFLFWRLWVRTFDRLLYEGHCLRSFIYYRCR